MHSEYIREITNSPIAVLMIHGIAGTPAHFRELLPIIPENWSVHNILLDGHGKRVEDFGASSMKKWKKQVKEKLHELFEKHKKVIIVAHSMGSLFAIQAAIDHPDKISNLFLLAVPLKIVMKLSTALTCIRVGLGNIKPDDTKALAMKNDTGIQLERKLWKYITWLPRMFELLSESKRICKIISQLKVPCETFQSRFDEFVSMRPCKLLDGNPYIRNTILMDSGHFAYGKDDISLLQSRLRETIKIKLGEYQNDIR